MEKLGINTLNDLLQQSADAYKDRVAIVLGDNYLTYSRLDSCANYIAGILQNYGIETGDRVAVLSENSPQWGCIFFGILKAGAVVVSLDVFNSEVELEYILKKSGAKVCFASATQMPKLDGLNESIDTINCILPIPEINDLHESNFTRVEIDSDATALLIYTSGTMGNQKGVMLSHSNIISNVTAVFSYLPYKPGTRFLSLIPLSHMFGINAGFLAPLFKGGTVFYTKSLVATEILHALAESKAQILVLVPLILKNFYEKITTSIQRLPLLKRLLVQFLYWVALSMSRARISIGHVVFTKIHKLFGGCLQFFISGGAPLESNIEKFFNTVGIPILNGYGLTETSPIISVNTLDNRRIGSVGKVIPLVKVKQTAGNELLVSGPMVMKGYFNDSEATQQVLENGWFKTGDIGEIDSEGFIFIKERAKNVIVLPSGMKIFPNEIELVLSKSKYISEVCVVKRNTINGEEPVAIIYPNYTELKEVGSDETSQIIRQEIIRLQKQLPAYKKVLDFEVWPVELPKTSTKKYKCKVLEHIINRASHEAHQQAETAGADLNDYENKIAGILTRFLNNENLNISKQTYLQHDLGIDSIMKLELINFIENELGIKIPADIVYAIETFDDLVCTILKIPQTACQKKKLTHISENRKENGRLIKTICSWCILTTVKHLFRVELIHGDRIPKSGTFIIVANHTSMLDFPVLTAILPRKYKKIISAPAAHDYFYRKSFSTWLLRTGLNIFPMKRHGNYFDGLRICANKIKEGTPLVVFPEGTRSVSGKLQEFKSGIGYLVHELNVPVVPMYIDGAHHALPKGTSVPKLNKITVNAGEPIYASSIAGKYQEEPNYVIHQRITKHIHEAVEHLSKET